MLPEEVLRQIRDELMILPGVGSSILEISHRSAAFAAIHDDTRQLLRDFVGVPDSHEILFLQGGSRLQFSIVPLNLAVSDRPAGYIESGAWSKMAFAEASRLIDARSIWSGEASGFRAIPDANLVAAAGEWSFTYFASNETIHGVQFRPLPTPRGTALACDMSSDFLSRPIAVSDYAILFACAQKNAGVAGLTIAIVDRDRLSDAPRGMPGYLNLKNHIAAENLYNTPPTFGVYVLKLMLTWLRDRFGNLAAVEQQNLAKAKLLYDAIDRHPDCYRGHAERSARSMANITFFLPSDDETSQFLRGAKELGMTDLKGHRSVGGIRASLYNAMPPSAVRQLAEYMDAFAKSR
jgi:phosphoserine aminotransferase